MRLKDNVCSQRCFQTVTEFMCLMIIIMVKQYLVDTLSPYYIAIQLKPVVAPDLVFVFVCFCQGGATREENAFLREQKF